MAEASPSRALLSDRTRALLSARSFKFPCARDALLVELSASRSLSNPPVAGSPWQELVTGDRSAVGYSADGGGAGGGGGSGGGGGGDGSDAGASSGGGGGYLEHQVVSHTLHSYPLFPHACRVLCTRHDTNGSTITSRDWRLAE